MKISDLEEVLARVKDQHGDIEVSLTGCLLDDGFSITESKTIHDVFESTLETHIVKEADKDYPSDRLAGMKRVRFYM